MGPKQNGSLISIPFRVRIFASMRLVMFLCLYVMLACLWLFARPGVFCVLMRRKINTTQNTISKLIANQFLRVFAARPNEY